MVKCLPHFVRARAAIIACLAGAALVGSPGAFGQIAAPEMVPAVSADGLAADSESRLTAVEEQLEKLLQAQAKREAKAAQRPSFQMGGQINIDYLWIGQNEANRLS